MGDRTSPSNRSWKGQGFGAVVLGKLASIAASNVITPIQPRSRGQCELISQVER